MSPCTVVCFSSFLNIIAPDIVIAATFVYTVVYLCKCLRDIVLTCASHSKVTVGDSCRSLVSGCSSYLNGCDLLTVLLVIAVCLHSAGSIYMHLHEGCVSYLI